MIQVRKFMGEFFLNSFPLQATLPRCGYNCAYCYVNEQRRPGKGFKEDDNDDLPKTVQAWRKYLRSQSGIVGEFLHRKSVIVISNMTDPFSPKVFEEARPFMEALLLEEIPICYQTRGGPQALSWAKNAPKALWKISLTSDDKTLTGETESITPRPEARMKLAEELRALGHTVEAAINPFIPTWWRDIPAFVKWAESIDVTGFFIQQLHLSSLYKSKVNPDTWRRLQPILDYKTGTGEEQQLFMQKARFLFASDKIPAWPDSGRELEFLKRNEAIYKPTAIIPTFYHFLHQQPLGEVSFDTFANYFISRLPDCIDKSIAEYAKIYTHVGFRETDNPKIKIQTYRELFHFFWQRPEVKTILWRSPYLSIRGIHSENGNIISHSDEHSNIMGVKTKHHPYHYFVPGFDSLD